MTPIYVTRPFLPPLADLAPALSTIWSTRRLTNDGPFHTELESALSQHLNIPHLALFSNGTLALITALQALRLTGEVITTPFTFIATANALWWNRLKPVFVDIDPDTLNLDPKKIEAAITPETSAIFPVHVYGNPCDTAAIEDIAQTHGLKVVYDAAHAFNVPNVLNAGDMSALSFHATKIFNTFEGGAVVCKTAAMKRRLERLRNFGFKDSTTEAIIDPGMNAKMNEFCAAVGLCQLTRMDWVTPERARVRGLYEQLLPKEALTLLASPNNSYVPVLVNYGGHWRDKIQVELAKVNVFTRRYFYPLVSNFPPYKALPSAAKGNLKVAHAIAERVLCLPIYPEMSDGDVERVCEGMRKVVD